MVAAAVVMAVVNRADFANLALLATAGPLGRKLAEAVVVPSEEVPPDVITMQSVVALVDEASGERVVVSLVYPTEADAASGRVSVLAPLGMATPSARRRAHLPAGAQHADPSGGARLMRVRRLPSAA